MKSDDRNKAFTLIQMALKMMNDVNMAVKLMTDKPLVSHFHLHRFRNQGSSVGMQSKQKLKKLLRRWKYFDCDLLCPLMSLVIDH